MGHTRNLTVICALGLAACSDPLVSDKEQIEFEDPFIGGWGFHSGDRVARGAHFCPSPVAWTLNGKTGYWPETTQFTECFQTTVGGLAAERDECLWFDGALGEIKWLFQSRPCMLGDASPKFANDSIRFVVSDISSVIPVLPEAVLADQGEIAPPPGSSFPEGWLDVGPPPYRFVTPGSGGFLLGGFDTEGNSVVWSKMNAYTDDGILINTNANTVDTISVGDRQLILDFVSPPMEGPYPEVLHIRADDTTGVLLVQRVSPDAIFSLELIPVFSPESDGHYPKYIRTIVRDKEGNRLFGAPIEWDVIEGGIDLSGLPYRIRGSDAKSVDVTCTSPLDDNGYHYITVLARVSGTEMQERVRFKWKPTFERGEGGSCGCVCSVRGHDDWQVTFGLLVVLLLRRRSAAKHPTHK